MSHPIRTMLMKVAAVALTVGGCGSSDGIPREPISGTVTFDGQPLANGQITFIPETGDNVVAAAITNGSYSLGRSEGPSPGPHRINIWSQVPTGKKVPSDPEVPGSELVDQMREAIPAQYNKTTKLKADVQKGGTNRFDFDTTSKPEATPKAKR